MINISEKILVGLTQPAANKLPETTISPVGKSSGERNKMARIKKDYKEVKELDNTPLPGFTLTSCGRNSWGSTETVWTVIDPRGFTSSITSSNLEKILHVTGVTEGLIQEKCVWARENERITMILIPVNTPEYTEAVTNTELITNKVSKREIKLGDKVLLQNKMTGTYFGTITLYSPAKIDATELAVTPKVMGRRSIIQVSPTQFYYQSDLKILSVQEPIETALTKVEASQILLDALKAGAVFSDYESLSNYSRHYRRDFIKHISYPLCTEGDMSYTREEVTLGEAKQLFDLGLGSFDTAVLMLEDSNGINYLIDMPDSEYTRNRDAFTYNKFRAYEASFSGGKIKISSKNMTQTRYHGPRFEVPQSLRNLNEFVKYYKIVKHTKTETFV